MNLILATSNVHKLGEIRKLLPRSYEITGLKDVGFTGTVPETGSTFHENAIQKARFIFNLYKLPVMADDSGLEVSALGGQPGIFSARYSGPNATDAQNVTKLLHEMEGVINREARFVAVIALIINEMEYFFEGSCSGHIALSTSGAGGFGYDPVFIPDDFNATFAELSPEVKNQISHRGEAMKKLVDFLENMQ